MRDFFKSKLKSVLKRVHRYFRSLDKHYEKQRIENQLKGFQSVGFGVRVNGKNHFFSDPRKIIIGNNVHIGSDAHFKSEGGLIIGNNTHISRRVTIYTENHNYEASALPYDNTTVYKPVYIGENVWIGMNVSIVPGVTIGEGAIIGLGTIVNRDVKPYEIVGSEKTLSLKYRDAKNYEYLKSNNAFGGVNGKLLGEEQYSNFFPSYKDNKQKPIAFVLGTGRSGSLSITNILNQHPNCKAFHENVRQLIRISTNLAQNKNVDKMNDELEALFETKVWCATNDQLIVHSDQRLWNLVPFLSTYFPNSKFIHLEREAVACIKSMVLRDWYQQDEYPNYAKHDWAKYRLRGDLMVDGMTENEWSKMTNVEKCTWYYFHINDSISNVFKELPESRKLSLRLDTLDQDLGKTLDFLNLNVVNLEVVKSNKIRQQDLLKKNTIDQSKLLSEIEAAIKVYGPSST